MNSRDQSETSALYKQLLDCWNRRDASEFAVLFEESGNQVGFDGSQVNGRSEIEKHLSQIFADQSNFFKTRRPNSMADRSWLNNWRRN